MVKNRFKLMVLPILCSISLAQEESTKNWGSMNFDFARSGGTPLCVLFVDPNLKSNSEAKFLEGNRCLDSAEVKQKLTSMVKLKIKSDGTNAKGWPSGLLNRAKNGAALMLASSDLTRIVFFDKLSAKEDIRPVNVLAAIKSIMDYETNKKAALDRQSQIKKKGRAFTEDKQGPPADENKPLSGLETLPGHDVPQSTTLKKKAEVEE